MLLKARVQFQVCAIYFGKDKQTKALIMWLVISIALENWFLSSSEWFWSAKQDSVSEYTDQFWSEPSWKFPSTLSGIWQRNTKKKNLLGTTQNCSESEISDQFQSVPVAQCKDLPFFTVTLSSHLLWLSLPLSLLSLTLILHWLPHFLLYHLLQICGTNILDTSVVLLLVLPSLKTTLLELPMKATLIPPIVFRVLLVNSPSVLLLIMVGVLVLLGNFFMSISVAPSLPLCHRSTILLSLFLTIVQTSAMLAFFKRGVIRLSMGRVGSPWPEGWPGPALKCLGPGPDTEGSAPQMRAKGQHKLKGRTRSDPGRARP